MLIVDHFQQTRFQSWLSLRHQLETCDDPFDRVSQFFNSKPRIKIYTDPFGPETWPTPWELIDENQFCKFNILLGICYTLQLTERFKNIQPVINVALDSANKTMYYLLLIKDKVYGYQEEEWTSIGNLSKNVKIQKSYRMPPLH